MATPNWVLHDPDDRDFLQQHVSFFQFDLAQLWLLNLWLVSTCTYWKIAMQSTRKQPQWISIIFIPPAYCWPGIQQLQIWRTTARAPTYKNPKFNKKEPGDKIFIIRRAFYVISSAANKTTQSSPIKGRFVPRLKTPVPLSDLPRDLWTVEWGILTLDEKCKWFLGSSSGQRLSILWTRGNYSRNERQKGDIMA